MISRIDQPMNAGMINHQQINEYNRTDSNMMTNFNQTVNKIIPITPNSAISNALRQPMASNHCDNAQNVQVSQMNSIGNVQDYLVRLIAENDANQLQNVPRNNVLQMMNSNLNGDPKIINTMIKPYDKYNIRVDSLQQHLEENESDINNQKQKKNISNLKKKVPKRFSAQEDLMLKHIVYTFGAKNWKLIASMMPNKTPRQCRDRYMNYLAPGYIYSNWTKKEDFLLADKYLEYGPQWSKIQKFFPFRTSNSIKNRFKYVISKNNNKIIEFLNSSSKQSKGKKKQEENNEKFEQIEIPLLDNEIDFSDQNNSNVFFDDFEIKENEFNFNYFD